MGGLIDKSGGDEFVITFFKNDKKIAEKIKISLKVDGKDANFEKLVAIDEILLTLEGRTR